MALKSKKSTEQPEKQIFALALPPNSYLWLGFPLGLHYSQLENKEDEE